MKRKISKLPLFMLGLAISGPPRPRFRTAIEAYGGGMDASAIFELAVWVFIFLYALYIILNYSLNEIHKTIVPNKYIKGAAKIYFLYALLAVASTAFSVLPAYTFYFAMKFFATFVLAAHIAQKHRQDPWVLFKVVFVTYAILFAIQIGNYFYDPTLVGVYRRNGEYRMTGGWLGGYGGYAAYSAFACFLIYLSGRLRDRQKLLLFLLFAVSLYFVYLSKTRQAFIFMAVTLIPLFFLTKKFKYTKFNLTYLVFLLLLVVYVLGIFDKFALAFVRDYQSIETLSGRTPIIFSSLQHWRSYMPFGDGFEAGSRYWLIRLGFAQQGLGSAHDSISKVMVELGVFGIVLLTLTLLVSWKQYWKVFNHAMLYWKHNPSKTKLFLLTIFLGGNIFYLTLTLATNSIFASGSLQVIIYLITLQILDIETRSEKKSHYARKDTQNIHHNSII